MLNTKAKLPNGAQDLMSGCVMAWYEYESRLCILLIVNHWLTEEKDEEEIRVWTD